MVAGSPEKQETPGNITGVGAQTLLINVKVIRQRKGRLDHIYWIANHQLKEWYQAQGAVLNHFKSEHFKTAQKRELVQ